MRLFGQMELDIEIRRQTKGRVKKNQRRATIRSKT